MRLFILPVVALLSGGAAMAQEAPLSKVYACAGIAESGARLACYDAAVGVLKQAEAAGGVAVVSREQLADVGKKSFGLSTPDLSDVAKVAPNVAAAAPVEAIDSIQAKITSAEKRANGKVRFVLDNGQIWDQLEAERIRGVNKLPVSAEIKKSMLGNFMMKIDGGIAIRVRRVQ